MYLVIFTLFYITFDANFFYIINSNSLTLLPHIDDVKRKLLREVIFNKRIVVSKLDKESKSLYDNVKSNLNLIDFHHVLNISLISNEKELEQIKFKHLSKLKNLMPNFTWDLVAASSHNPEKIILNFLLTNCHLAIKIFFLKDFVLLSHLSK